MAKYTVIEDLLDARAPRRRSFSAAIRTVEAAFVRTFWNHRPNTKCHSRLLNLGCGEVLIDGWINADFILPHQLIKGASKPDWSVDVTRRWNCTDDFFDGIYTEHLLEHLTYPEVVFALREAYRTLKPGGWFRIVVPDIAKYVAFYSDEEFDEAFSSRFASGVLGISAVTQCFEHLSVWDAPTMVSVVTEIGFVDVSQVSHGEGTDKRLLVDSTARKWESLYIEARKLGSVGSLPLG